eukprot:TRINITY_DN8237_c0_g1_i1.p1 TRINITY_DN8237_c0_g1~~TRINITY_DN8237_c0_g1_i1.p1  ORF type:complete len:525 (-),score=78.43 TRINITY_DN8237_c0_g1_i1:3-1577(-)
MNHISEMIQEITKIAPGMPSVHFLLYLYFMKNGEYQKSIDYLHQYFDHTFSDDSISLLPYGSLNLASLNHNFGNSAKGIKLIHETIRLAQERNDDSCLALALSWLFKLVQSTKSNHLQEYQLLKRIVSRSVDLDLLDLSTTSTLSLAQNYLVYPREKVDGIMKHQSEDIKIHSNKIWSILNLNTLINTQGSFSEKNMSANYLLRMNAWTIFGNKEMSIICSEIQQHAFNDNNSSEDEYRIHCHQALLHSDLGNLDASIRILRELKIKHNPPLTQNIWKYTYYTILHTWALRRNNLAEAENLSLQLEAVTPLGDVTSYIETKYRNILLSMKKNNWSQAYGMAIDLVATCKKNGHEYQRVCLFLLIGNIFVRLGVYTNALKYILSCITLGERYQLESVVARAKIVFVNILLLQGRDPYQIEIRLDNIMPIILKNCDAESQGISYLVYSKLLISKYKYEESINILSLAEELFGKIEDVERMKEVYYLKSRIYDLEGNIKLRNHYAELYNSPRNHVKEDESISGYYIE